MIHPLGPFPMGDLFLNPPSECLLIQRYLDLWHLPEVIVGESGSPMQPGLGTPPRGGLDPDLFQRWIPQLFFSN